MAHTRLVVIGAAGPIGRAVARLGIAYGADVIGIDRAGPPGTGEPWEVGVHWETTDGSRGGEWLAEATAVVVAAPIDLPSLLDALQPAAPTRVVVVAEPSAQFAAATTDRLVLATPHEVVDTPLDPEVPTADARSIHVERLGMALLRAALDDDIPATLDHDALCELGDAMFWQ